MKTTQKRAVAAYRALQEIGRQPFPVRDALRLLQAKKRLEMAWEFQLQEENKLIESYQPEVRDGKLIMSYGKDDAEGKARAQEFMDKMKELQELEVEIEGEPVPVRMPGDEIRIRPETLAALDGIVSWEEAEG